MSNFFKRWSDLKTSQAPQVVPEPLPELPVTKADTAQPELSENPPLTVAAPQGPTLEDVQNLQRDSDFSKFMQAEVGEDVHQAAMKKLFTDPHYNIMDGLDIYIDDYSKEDPLPAGMLEKMVQSSLLGLFKKAEEEPVVAPQLDQAEASSSPPLEVELSAPLEALPQISDVAKVTAAETVTATTAAGHTEHVNLLPIKGSHNDSDLSL